MKKVWLYCLALFAMSFAFVSPAQALEGWEGFAPAADHAAPVDIGEGSTDCLAVCTRPQLEAAVLLVSKSGSHGITKMSDYRSGHAIPVAGPDERGWRKLA